jgi:hypothetical protein
LLALTSVRLSDADGKLLNVMRPMVERELIERRDKMVDWVLYGGSLFLWSN